MEKASTPPNRLTRSAAKQVNTPSRKVESVEEPNIVTRKPRKKTETKLKTNGEALSNIERKNTKHYEEVSDSNSIDSCASEDSNPSIRQSSKLTNRNTPSIISRKSLRNRRSVTPCPELDNSVSKPMKRSTSESKLGSICTMRNKRGSRAISESKDFVFTPKTDDTQEVSSLSKSSTTIIHRNSKLRIIDESAEASEIDESSQDNQQGINLTLDKGDNDQNTIKLQDDIILSGDEIVIGSEKTVESNNILVKENENRSCDLLTAAKDDSNVVPANKEGILSSTEKSEIKQFKDEVELKKDDSIIEIYSVCDKDSNDNPQRLIDVNAENDIKIYVSKNVGYNTNEIDITGDDNDCNDKSVIDTNKADMVVEIENENFDSIQKSVVTGERASFNIDFRNCAVNTATENSIQTDSPSSLNLEVTGKDQIIENVSSGEDCISVVSVEVNETITCNKEKGDGTPSTIKNDNIFIINQSNDINSLMHSIPIPKVSGEKDAELVLGQMESETNESIVTKQISDMVVLDVDCNVNHAEIHKDNSDNNAFDIVPPCLNVSENIIHEEYKIENPVTDLKTDEILPLRVLTLQPDGVKECNKAINTQIENPMSIVNDEVNDSYNLHINQSLDIVDSHDLCENGQSENIVLHEESNKSQSINIHSSNEIKHSDYSERNLSPEDDDSQNKTNVKYSREAISSQDTCKGKSPVKNENSDSNSDLYKDMSDIGSDSKDESRLHKFDDNLSTDSESGESEEDISSIVDDDSNHQDGSDKFVEVKKTTECKNNEGEIKKNNEKIFDTSSPMTYDKALAILNKNRVQKIDDEEFFDMFTQELNRVSAESGSDSDIAIVDEYIMEPEEPNDTNQNISNIRQFNSKLPINPHSPTLTSMHLSEHLAGVYNKQFPSQQNNPLISKTNVSQGSMYQHYGQNMMTPGRGSHMYEQCTQGSMTMPDPRTLNPPTHSSDMHFNRTGPFISHGLESCSNSNIHYPNSQSIKVKSIHSLNSPQHPIKLINHDNLSDINKPVCNAGFDYVESYNRNVTVNASTMTDQDDKQNQAQIYNLPISRGDNQSMETVLDALGLNEEKLQLLKMALGLDGSKVLDDSRRNYLLRRKHRKRIKIKTPCTKNDDSNRQTENSYGLEISNSSSSTEDSNDDGSNNIECVEDQNIKNEQFECSSDERSGNRDRRINIKDNMSVTFKTIPQISSNHQSYDKFDTISKSSQILQNPIKKRKRAPEQTKYKHFDSTLIPYKRKKMYIMNKQLNEAHDENIQILKQEAKDINSRKASRIKKHGKKQLQKLLKSNCGIFTIDCVTDNIQSSGASESDLNSCSEQLAGPSNYVQDMLQNKQGISDSVREKTRKHSGLVSDRSFKKMKPNKKEKLEKKKMARTLKKLPMGILEGLLDEEQMVKKSQKRYSDSDKRSDKPMHPRKRASKVKHAGKVARQGYMPCVTQGATQFSLSHLDDDSLESAAEIAAKFRSDQLYGSSIKRVTILDFKG